MESQIYVAISQQDALSRQMDVVANNIANMNTTGYKMQATTFDSLVEGSGKDKVSYVTDGPQYRDMGEGPIQTTGNTYDLAIQGHGWFMVQGDNGQQFYTRDGSFHINSSKQIVTSNDQLVLNSSGSPITLPDNAIDVKITSDGSVSTPAGTVGQIGIVGFANEQDLQSAGNNLYTTNDPSQPATGAHIMQGVLEGSNVNPVMETTRMMSILRSYQMAENIADDEHQRIESMINKLGQN